MGLFSRTLSRIDEIKRSLTRETGPRQFLAVADEHRRQGRPREAIDILEAGLAQSPSSVAGFVALGRLFQQTGQLEKAIDSFQSALKLDPQNLVAIRQLAEVHLTRGEKVEAIKRLKLFRGLSPGDREVADLIRQLDAELAPPPSPRAGLRLPVPSVPLPSVPGTAPAPSAPVAVEAPKPAQAPVPPNVPEAAASVAASSPDVAAAPKVETLPDVPAWGIMPEPAVADVEPEAPPMADERSTSSLPVPEDPPEFLAELQPVRDLEPPAIEGEPELPVESAPAEAASALSFASPPPPEAALPPSAPVPESAPPVQVPTATETLAGLLRAQGHLGRAREAYLELARTEPDPAKAKRYLDAAAEIAAARSASARGRLEAWVEPFGRGGPHPNNGDLVTAVEEIVERLAPAAALVTDLEGVPVVTVGPRFEAEAMESLSAELTAFWKNVRRARAEVGKGALRSLVLTGSAGTAAVQAITPEYALLLKTGPGVPVGRIRFEAARAAEQLRPALL
jgi:tetratricopeptide (TPR) repeat protein/predicted regulator of Ras-like GTPase activity (Roadblock/LC7/MglB family)